MRRAHFRVFGRFDGVAGATVTIEGASSADPIGTWLIRVRPRGRRRTFDLPLDVVARDVIFVVTRAELRARNAARLQNKGIRRH